MPRRNRGYRREPGALRVFLYSVLMISLSQSVAASPGVNITIDNASRTGRSHTPPFTNSTIPPGSDDTVPRWANQTCSNCSSTPDLNQLQDRTFTAIYLPAGNNFTYDISFQFNGTAIYVYIFLSNQAPTACDFILDGNSNPYEGKTPDPYTYNVLAFSEPELALEMHNLTIRVSGNPDTTNYLGFNYANFTRPPSKIFMNASTPPSSSSSSPSPTTSTTAEDGHEMVKAIVGGVVGGFLAILALVLVASFYRNRRLRELEKEANPFFGVPNETRVLPSRAEEEEHHLIPRASTGAFGSNHTQLDNQTAPRRTAFRAGAYDTRPHPFPLPTDHAPSNVETDARNRVRQQRQREINDRLQNAKTHLRSLQSSYSQDQQRLQNQTQQGTQEFGRGHVEGHHERDNPVIRLVPGGMPDPVTGRNGSGPGARQNTTGEPMVNPNELVDIRNQMGLMLDQIQYLRAQQNSPYAQGLTDEPPPGYAEVINWDHIR